MLMLIFVPFIVVHHPDTSRFIRLGPNEGAFLSITRGVYSPFQFITMLFSSNYDLRGHSVTAVISIVLLLSSLVAIAFGGFLLLQRNKKSP